MSVAITLTLTLSHRGRGDEEVLPEDSFCVGRTVAHAAGEVFQMAF